MTVDLGDLQDLLDRLRSEMRVTGAAFNHEIFSLVQAMALVGVVERLDNLDSNLASIARDLDQIERHLNGRT